MPDKNRRADGAPSPRETVCPSGLSLDEMHERLRLIRHGDLPDDLRPDSLHELLALAHRHYERTRTTYDAILVVAVEALDIEVARRFEHDRQAIDGDPACNRLVAGCRDRTALVVGPVA